MILIMDSLSVISISSTSSDDDNSILTVNSEIQRVPVGDKNAKKQNVSEVETTPDHARKVQVWMDSCQSEDLSEKQPSTCIRYDFEKTSITSPPTPKSCFTQATPLFTYMEKAKKLCLKNADQRPNGKNSNILSPETHKKELCNYLQLMKPDETNHSFFIEYRRSGRVKLQNNDSAEQKSPKIPTLKSFEELNLKMSAILSCSTNEMMPLPPKRIYKQVSDFEDCVRDYLGDKLAEKTKKLSKIEKRRKFKFKLRQKLKHNRFLRSKGYLRNLNLDRLVKNKNKGRKVVEKVRKSSPKRVVSPRCEIVSVHVSSDEDNDRRTEPKPPSPKITSPRCEIVSVLCSDDENIDLKNFVDDMLGLDKMSEEHRKSVIESRILASSAITNLINKRTNQEDDVQRAYRIFSDLSNERKFSEEKENDEKSQVEERNREIEEHNYASVRSSIDEEEEEEEEEDHEDEVTPVPIPNLQVLPVTQEKIAKSLHRSLNHVKRKNLMNNYLQNWSNSNRKMNHSISISRKNGQILKAYYQDFNLVIAQENLVSFWTQSALGNVLGAQNMWIPKGQVQRIALNSTYVQKQAMEMVITTETSVAYVELWTKEHKSDLREVPVADVFATVYFWRLRQNGLDKKAVQLENIKGFADDVQYCVLKSYPKIIVSWSSVQGGEKRTKIHSYHLAADFQTVANISEIQPVEHYVASLHNIEDCDSLVMGCGENKIALWNVEYGYVVAIIEMTSIRSPLATLWVKCDRGFLFTIQKCVNQDLTLVAINGMNHSWKKLQSYSPSPGYDRLKGVCIENGILVAYYSQGILCWNAQSGEMIVEEVPNECEFIPCGKHVIMIAKENIIVKHSLSYLITDL